MRVLPVAVSAVVLSLLACMGGAPDSPDADGTGDVPVPVPSTEPAPAPVPGVGTTTGPDRLDLASVYSGARVIEATPVYDETKNLPVAALDFSDETPWASHDQVPGPHRFVLELATPAKLDRAVLVGVKSNDGNAQPIHVAISTSDVATGPFAPAAEVDVTPGAEAPTEMALGQTARYLAFDIAGKDDPTATNLVIDEVHVYGEPIGTMPTVSFAGVFDTRLSGIGPMVLAQSGTRVYGCMAVWDVEGQAEGRIANLRMTPAEPPNSTFDVLLVLADDASSGTGVAWIEQPDGRREWHLPMDAQVHDPSIAYAPCRRIDPVGTEPDRDAGSPMEQDLAAGRKALIYGIKFDFDSDRIKPESKPVLDEITGILKAHGDWQMSIEGHTDSIGDATYNQTLSEKRAAAVVAALVSSGIDAARLTSAGYGESQPIESNDTVMGRAQNRRVVLVKP